MPKLVVMVLLSLLLCAVTQGSSPGTKTIVLTFDNLPGLHPLGFWTHREVSNTILRTLEKYNVKAAGFVVEEKIDEDPVTFIVLKDWIERGHILGNQTYSDVDLNDLSAKDFMHHVTDGQTYLKRILRMYSQKYLYLRYPFLHQGNTKRKKRRVTKALYRLGYDIAHVTVKTSDYRFNSFYIDNEQNHDQIVRLKSVYLEHIAQVLNYAESQSLKVFSRQIHHILRLHCGIATAQFLKDLIEILKGRGYGFIALDKALLDPAFQTKELYVGPGSLSFIDRVAATRGLDFDPQKGELSEADIKARMASLTKSNSPLPDSIHKKSRDQN